jgi:hypothetical protein
MAVRCTVEKAWATFAISVIRPAGIGGDSA